ncbi:hypothetical protein AWM75_03425 [Aerococcus urinaehominis]|uniref:Uncharacterized protein n=1 Tax=Aerococcus urinaehominis TaxID=128944 RepID=A0A0X8FL67_9LACT|nr:thioredoxin family protein [Aerococcus urinaehominis]AMB99109.1 hypothetical protein AWM75_03425 [Aerococcus urinaehominis]SDM03981.1 Thiol-disulfide isomerase or thioredoxin [Aerococcus urinaehominis]
MIKQVASLADIEATIAANDQVLVYLTGHNCGICQALRPQLEEVTANYPDLVVIEASLSDLPQLAGAFMVFTIPVVMLYGAGQERARFARVVPRADLVAALDQLSYY